MEYLVGQNQSAVQAGALRQNARARPVVSFASRRAVCAGLVLRRGWRRWSKSHQPAGGHRKRVARRLCAHDDDPPHRRRTRHARAGVHRAAHTVFTGRPRHRRRT